MVKNINVYGKTPKIVGDSEIISFEDMSYFLYNDKDVTLGTCELYVNVEPYILITTFANNVEAKQFIQQHSEDIKSAVIAIGSAEVTLKIEASTTSIGLFPRSPLLLSVILPELK